MYVGGKHLLVLGNPAIVSAACAAALDPWLCDAGFRRVCLSRYALAVSTCTPSIGQRYVQNFVNSVTR